MSSRSIVDRVLLFAAAVCVAGLVWQLTVLITSRNHPASYHRIEAATPAMAQVSDDAPATAPSSPVSTVRVVYPDGVSTKSTGKATDIVGTAPPAPSEPLSTRSVTLTPVALTTPDTTTNSPPVKPADQTSATPQADAGIDSPAADQAPGPTAAKVASLSPAAGSSPPLATEAKAASRQAININNASIEALNHLPGAGRIGQAIASHRPYHSVEDLLKKRVVRRNIYDQIKGQLAAQ